MSRTTSKKKKKTEDYRVIGVVLMIVIAIVLLGIQIIKPLYDKNQYIVVSSDTLEGRMPDIDVQLLTVNPYSRPGTPVKEIKGVVVHYTANPGSTAKENRDFFESLKDTKKQKVSSNFVIGLEGEIVQCIPTWEIAYASNSRNIDTISIECCHPDETGTFTNETYMSMIQLCGWLCMKYGLTAEDVIRHYDVTGKNCPKYFVENEEAFLKFREEVDLYIQEGKIKIP